MVNDELVDLIAEAIYGHFRDKETGIKTLDYLRLSEEVKNFYRNIAHDVMCVYDDFFDAELDEDDDFDADEYDDGYADTEDIAMEDEDPDDDYEAHLDYTEL